MRIYRAGKLPPDLKSFSSGKRHDDLKEALHAIASLLLIVAMLFMFMIAAAAPEPQINPVGWEEVRG